MRFNTLWRIAGALVALALISTTAPPEVAAQGCIICVNNSCEGGHMDGWYTCIAAGAGSWCELRDTCHEVGLVEELEEQVLPDSTLHYGVAAADDAFQVVACWGGTEGVVYTPEGVTARREEAAEIVIRFH